MPESLQQAFSLEGELALITGGATGLGFAVAKAFTLAGARVILAGRRQDVLAASAASLGPSASWAEYDVRDMAAAKPLVERLEKEHGSISILVNNAGNSRKKPIEDHSDEDFRDVMDTHVTGAFALSRAMVPSMKRRGRGNILFTASMASLFGIPYVVAYSAAKSAYLGMVRSLAVELAPSGIRVNAVAPGWIVTDLVKKTVMADEQRKNKILARTPMARFGEPEEIGWAAVYLCSPAASFVTGAVLPVDGGVSIGF